MRWTGGINFTSLFLLPGNRAAFDGRRLYSRQRRHRFDHRRRARIWKSRKTDGNLSSHRPFLPRPSTTAHLRPRFHHSARLGHHRPGSLQHQLQTFHFQESIPELWSHHRMHGENRNAETQISTSQNEGRRERRKRRQRRLSRERWSQRRTEMRRSFMHYQSFHGGFEFFSSY